MSDSFNRPPAAGPYAHDSFHHVGSGSSGVYGSGYGGSYDFRGCAGDPNLAERRDPNEPEVAVDPTDDSPFAIGRMLEVFGEPNNTWREAIVINNSHGAGAGSVSGYGYSSGVVYGSANVGTPLRIKYHFYGMPDSTWDGWLCTEGDADRMRVLGAGIAPSAEEQRCQERDQIFRALLLSDGGDGDTNGSSSRRVIVEMDRDGNCLFRSFAYQVTYVHFIFCSHPETI